MSGATWHGSQRPCHMARQPAAVHTRMGARVRAGWLVLTAAPVAGYTALHEAALYGHIDVVRTLLARKVISRPNTEKRNAKPAATRLLQVRQQVSAPGWRQQVSAPRCSCVPGPKRGTRETRKARNQKGAWHARLLLGPGVQGRKGAASRSASVAIPPWCLAAGFAQLAFPAPLA